MQQYENDLFQAMDEMAEDPHVVTVDVDGYTQRIVVRGKEKLTVDSVVEMITDGLKSQGYVI